MTTPAPNFRALCGDMLFAVQLYTGQNPAASEMSSVEVTEKLMDAMAATAAALATPPPEPPTVMEILDLSGEIEDAGLGQIDLVRAALERWGQR